MGTTALWPLLFPLAGVLASALIGGIFLLASRRTADEMAARKELLDSKNERIADLTVERDEARSERDDAKRERDEALRREVEYRDQIVHLEAIVETTGRPTRRTKLPND